MVVERYVAMAIKNVFIDISGTLHVGSETTFNAIAALQSLRDSEINVKFVTNATKESRRLLYDRLRRLGFHVEENEIFTSLLAARALVERERYKKPMVFLEKSAMEDFKGIPRCGDDEYADAVVMGLSPSLFNYSALNEAFRHVLNGATLIAVHKSRYFKEPDGLSLGPGAFVHGIEYAADITATVVGKPEPAFFQEALGDIDPSTCIMIGDDVRYDIAGAQTCGIRGILVKTGKYRTGDEELIDPPPYAVCDNFNDAIGKILEMEE